MNTQALKFIKEKIGGLANQFPGVQFKYAYNRVIDSHVVQIEPESAYYYNSALDDAWIPVSVAFEETFAEESICFISSDSTLKIEQPELEWNKPMPLQDYNRIVETLLNATEITLDIPGLSFIWSENDLLKVLNKATLIELVMDIDFQTELKGSFNYQNVLPNTLQLVASSSEEQDYLPCAA